MVPEFRDDVRIATVRKYAPPNLKSHLQLTAEEYEGSYPRFCTKVEGLFASREQEEKPDEQSSAGALSGSVGSSASLWQLIMSPGSSALLGSGVGGLSTCLPFGL